MWARTRIPTLFQDGDADVTTSITNYDGAIVTTPQEYVQPRSVEELQAILRDTNRYPGPVRALGSNHSLTPCAASTGTIVSMADLNAGGARSTPRR